MTPLIVPDAFIFILLQCKYIFECRFFTPSLTAVMTLTWWSIIMQNKHNLCMSLFASIIFLTISKRSDIFTVKVHHQIPSFLLLVTVCRSEVLPTLEEDQVQNHLRKMSIHKSMGPNMMNPGVLSRLSTRLWLYFLRFSKVYDDSKRFLMDEKRQNQGYPEKRKVTNDQPIFSL